MCWAASLSLAHEFRPGHLRLIEVEETAARFHVVWKKPLLTNTNLVLVPFDLYVYQTAAADTQSHRCRDPRVKIYPDLPTFDAKNGLAEIP